MGLQGRSSFRNACTHTCDCKGSLDVRITVYTPACVCIFKSQVCPSKLSLRRKLRDGLIYVWSICFSSEGIVHRFVGSVLCEPNEYACSLAMRKAFQPSHMVTVCMLTHNGSAWLTSNFSPWMRVNNDSTVTKIRSVKK